MLIFWSYHHISPYHGLILIRVGCPYTDDSVDVDSAWLVSGFTKIHTKGGHKKHKLTTKQPPWDNADVLWWLCYSRCVLIWKRFHSPHFRLCYSGGVILVILNTILCYCLPKTELCDRRHKIQFIRAQKIHLKLPSMLYDVTFSWPYLVWLFHLIPFRGIINLI